MVNPCKIFMERYMADNIQIDGLVEQQKELEQLMMSNPASMTACPTCMGVPKEGKSLYWAGSST